MMHKLRFEANLSFGGKQNKTTFNVEQLQITHSTLKGTLFKLSYYLTLLFSFKK